jgi:hypothetical protein
VPVTFLYGRLVEREKEMEKEKEMERKGEKRRNREKEREGGRDRGRWGPSRIVKEHSCPSLSLRLSMIATFHLE